jgi:phosphatidylglycerophosphatase A
VDRFIIWLASGGYSGYFPHGPGTAGTLVGILIYFLFSFFPPSIYLLTTGAAFFLAWWASERAEVLFSQRDCPKIVIDEIAGYLITMALLPRTLTTVIGGFLFFRIFDIMKTPPAGFVERRLSGGLAVVLDDAVAGIYANVLLHAIILWRPHLLFILDRWYWGPG